MFVPIGRLFARQARSRATELVALKRRLRAERATSERDDAMRIRSLKARIAAETGAVSSCGRCAIGRPWPGGAYDGGHCCSGQTEELFGADEVAALAQAGTRARDLVAPRGEHPGCAFRGPVGCTLAAEHRPALCLRFVCDELRSELHRRGKLDRVEALAAELAEAFTRFATALAARREHAWLEAVAREL
jgi:hypothetical protein